MIYSLLDNDKYAWLMSYAFWKCWPEHNIEFRFKNRSLDIALGSIISLSLLEEQIAAIRKLQYTKAEIDWLNKQNLFDAEYIDALQHTNFTLPEVSVWLDKAGWLQLQYEGPAWLAVFWETMLLSCIKEQYVNTVLTNHAIAQQEAMNRLQRKLAIMHENQIAVHEFGTRRRASQKWQQMVVEEMLQYAELLLSTSNAALAKQYALAWSGTIAHLVYMCQAALLSQQYQNPLPLAYLEVYRVWTHLYQDKIKLCMLPDTFGSAHFFREAPVAQLRSWPVTRIDSGEPVYEAHVALGRLHMLGVNLSEHELMFSDNLDLNTMLMLKKAMQQQPHSFGYGTNLSSDWPITNPNMVIKPYSIDGIRTCKIPNDLTKASGDEAIITQYLKMLEM